MMEQGSLQTWKEALGPILNAQILWRMSFIYQDAKLLEGD